MSWYKNDYPALQGSYPPQDDDQREDHSSLGDRTVPSQDDYHVPAASSSHQTPSMYTFSGGQSYGPTQQAMQLVPGHTDPHPLHDDTTDPHAASPAALTHSMNLPRPHHAVSTSAPTPAMAGPRSPPTFAAADRQDHPHHQPALPTTAAPRNHSTTGTPAPSTGEPPAKRSKHGQPRMTCGCTCGCQKTFYKRTTKANVQCASCLKDERGRCSAPKFAAASRPPLLTAGMGGLPSTPYPPPDLPPLRMSDYEGTTHRFEPQPDGTSRLLFEPRSEAAVTPADASDQRPRTASELIQSSRDYYAPAAGGIISDGDAAARDRPSLQPTPQLRKRRAPASALMTSPSDQNTTISLPQSTLPTTNHSTQPACSPQYRVPFANEAQIDAFFAGDTAITYLTLNIADDDLDTVTENKKRDLCSQLFTAILAPPAAPPADLPQQEQDTWILRQTEAREQCKTTLGSTTEDHLVASARCDKLYYITARLHTEGIPTHFVKRGGKVTKSGYTLDKTSPFTARFAQMIEAVGQSKRVAYDLLTGQRMEDFARAPPSFLRRKNNNCLVNGRRGDARKSGKGGSVAVGQEGSVGGGGEVVLGEGNEDSGGFDASGVTQAPAFPAYAEEGAGLLPGGKTRKRGYEAVCKTDEEAAEEEEGNGEAEDGGGE